MNNQKIKRHLAKFRTYLFSYKEGYFEFPYLAHSPQDMIDGFDSTLFVKHHRNLGYMTTRTPFMNAEMIYHQVDEGLWVTLANAKYYANVNFKRIVDKQHPSNFYFLSLEVAQQRIKNNSSLLNGMTYSNTSWLLFKPEVLNGTCHTKGVTQRSLTIFFNEDYLQKTLLRDAKLSKSVLKGFFSSKHKTIIRPEMGDVALELSDPLIDQLQKKKEGTEPEASKLNAEIHRLIHRFIDLYDTEAVVDHYVELSDSSTKKMLKAEKLLMSQLGKPFQGIESLAEKVGVSLSALKSDFKILFGQSIYQYFRSRQMQYARQLLMEEKGSIKEMAQILGYQNPSKFTVAFKNEFGFLPSRMPQTETENTARPNTDV